MDLAVGAWLLPELVGRGAAMDLVLTGRWLEADEALALGLLNHVSEDPERLASQLAAELAARGVGNGVKTIMAAWRPDGPAAGRAHGQSVGVGARNRRPAGHPGHGRVTIGHADWL